jgi:hypothetical protein
MLDLASRVPTARHSRERSDSSARGVAAVPRRRQPRGRC